MWSRTAFVLACLWASAASAQWRAVLVARTGEGAFAPGAVRARAGEVVEVRVLLRAPDGRSLSDAPRVRGHRVDGPLPAEARVEWMRVAPIHDRYSNVVPWGAFEGRWRGIEPVRYANEPLREGASTALEDRLVRVRGADGGPGTLWLAAEVALPDGTRVRTPDASSAGRNGLRADVLRASFRGGDDFLGHLAAYFGVPFVFGSVARQVDRYAGADCADVLVGALRSMGRRAPYVSVAGLRRLARAIGPEIVLDRGGTRTRDGRPIELRWGRDVVAGDLIAIDYDAGTPLTRRWDHVGALVSDDGDGALGAGDLLRHMTPRGLADRPLSDHGGAVLRVWRFRHVPGPAAPRS